MYFTGSNEDIFSDELKNFKGLFFQDVQMMQSFKSYPEIVFIDATYKLLQIGVPTYLMLAEDSNGQSEVVFGCILMWEDKESINWMIETF